MRAVIVRISAIALLLVGVALAGTIPIFSDNGASQLRRQGEGGQAEQTRTRQHAARSPLSYRSPGSSHKIVVRADDKEIENRILSSGAARKVRKYNQYTLIEVDDGAIRSLNSNTLEGAQFRDDLNLIFTRRGQIDTTAPEPDIKPELRQPAGLAHSLHLVQLFGPPTNDSLRALETTGAKIVSYIPNNAYLVWASPAQVEALGKESDIVQWDGPFHPAYKLDPRINLDSRQQVRVSIAVLDSPEAAETVARISAASNKNLMQAFASGGAIHLKMLVDPAKLADMARIADVLAIEPWPEMKLKDERVNQIVAGALSEEIVNSINVGRPSTPGFLSFLSARGFGSTFDFAIDIADTGLDIGSGDKTRVHRDFLDIAGSSRVAYLNDLTSDASFHPNNPEILPAHDTIGHGTINASIAGGYNTNASADFRDPLGFQYGLGVAPYARIGISKIFDDDGDFGIGTSYFSYITSAYRRGARISSNSWGGDCDTGFCNLYTDDAAIYDSIVRDADPEAFGNQELTVIFAAGNDGFSGNNTIGIPATAKNIITVGASESFRSSDADGKKFTDGCGVTPESADNALDISGFSSGGPVQDGRAKPDLVAPGSHVTGAASQDPVYATLAPDLLGVCNRYFPEGQTLYSLSSGTSHSTPVVAGGAALGFQWLKTSLGTEPSPALVKAFMLNSTSYMTGHLAGDDLPGVRQGWGLLDLARMFDTTDRMIFDQSPSRTFTESGGAPFIATGIITDPTKEFRVMLAWTDPPGNASVNAPYINQLNLEVVVGGVVYQANNFSGAYSKPGGQTDILNNVQGVRLPPGVTGPFVVRVRPTVIAGNGVPGNNFPLDQDFALVVTNGREKAVPVLTIEAGDGVSKGINITHPNQHQDAALIPGESVSISVTVRNESATAAHISSATLRLGNGAPAGAAFPVIAGGQSAANTLPFQIQVPSNLGCGSIASLQLNLETDEGRVSLPVLIRVGAETTANAVLLQDDVDSGLVVWKFKKGFFPTQTVGNSGRSSYHVEDSGLLQATRLGLLILKKKVKIPQNAGNVRLSFFHIYNFEPGYDGGALEISTDNGKNWEDLGSRIIVGGYDGKLTSSSDNPLGDRFAWTARGLPGVFRQVVVNLDDFAGKNIKIRFLGGFDAAVGSLEGYTGWYIDDIRISASQFACNASQSVGAAREFSHKRLPRLVVTQ